MKTVLYNTQTNQLLTKQKFKDGYKPPEDHDWQKEKTDQKYVELIVVEHAHPSEYDRETHQVIKHEYADLKVKNEYDGEWHEDWRVVERENIAEILMKRAAREQTIAETNQKTAEIKMISDELKSTSPKNPNLKDKERIEALENRIEKLEKLIL